MHTFALVGEQKTKEYLEKVLRLQADVLKSADIKAQIAGAGERTKFILNAMGENTTAETLLELAAFAYKNRLAGAAFEKVTGSNSVTPELAALIAHGTTDATPYMDEIEDAYRIMRILLAAEESSDDIMKASFSMNHRMAAFLAGNDAMPLDIRGFGHVRRKDAVLPTIYAYTNEISRFTYEISKMYFRLKMSGNKELFTIAITGEEGSGRRTSASYLAGQLGLNLVCADYRLIMRNNDPKLIIRKLVRECFFCDGALLVFGVTRDEDNSYKDIINEIQKEYSFLGFRPLFVSCELDVKLAPVLDGYYSEYSIGKCTPDKSLALWEGFLGENFNAGLSAAGVRDVTLEINIHEIASKMVLTAGQIEKIVKLLYTRILSEGEACKYDNKLMYKLCYKVLDDGRYSNVKKVNTNYTLDDVKIPPHKKEILVDICNQMIYREFVYNDWNLCSKYTYGRCLSALFAGPPGTGKTMAVHAIANELGLELYKVDLSQIVDKYVGETEKRLEEVFNTAQKSNMVLFFDEADAVLGKRTETKDASDKYANTEIAYILQRMEEFDGIVIMATNYLQNIDVAFMRRIRYVVSFDMPDEALRKQIWMSAFPKEIPLSSEVNFDYLANQFEIAGGNIKNIVLNAIFFAAPNKEEVNMNHIIKSICRENTKDKKYSIASSFGAYADIARIYLQPQ